MDRQSERGDELHARLIEGMAVTELRLDLAGVSTPVLQAGDGPPVVLLHGQGGFGAMWGPMIMLLAGNHRVIAPDLPGLGRSDVTSGAVDESRLIAWLDELIAKTCDTPPILIGHSLGGSVALRYASHRSDRLRRLILINPGSLARFRPSPRLIYAMIRMGKSPSPTALKRMQRHIFLEPERVMSQMGDRRAAFEAYQLDRASRPAIGAANRRLLRDVGAEMPEEQLRKISVPVRMIWGRRDKILPFSAGERAAGRFGWQLHPIEDAAHIPQAEQPAAFVGALMSAMTEA